jgi:hypothetical protein
MIEFGIISLSKTTVRLWNLRPSGVATTTSR